MVVSSVRLVSRWLSKLGAVSTSPVVCKSGPLASDGRVFLRVLTKDPFMASLYIGLASLIGCIGYSVSHCI